MSSVISASARSFSAAARTPAKGSTSAPDFAEPEVLVSVRQRGSAHGVGEADLARGRLRAARRQEIGIGGNGLAAQKPAQRGCKIGRASCRERVCQYV